MENNVVGPFVKSFVVGIVVSAVLIGTVSIAKDEGMARPKRGLPLDGFRVIGTPDRQAAKPTVSLTIVSEKDKPAEFNQTVELVAQKFVGSMVSRTFSPKDFEISTLETKRISRRIPAGGSVTVTVVFDAKAPKNLPVMSSLAYRFATPKGPQVVASQGIPTEKFRVASNR